MKKALLLSVFGMAAMGAFALNDITPANYNYNNANEFNYHDAVYGTANIAAPVWETIDGNQYFDSKNGLVVLCGAVAGWGAGNADPKPLMETVDGPLLVAGTSIVDLGGEIGKVLCLNGMKSNLNDRLKELYDVDLQIPAMTGALHWCNLNYFVDPNQIPADGSDDYFNVRVRVTFNVFYNFPEGQQDGIALANLYPVGNQNNNFGEIANDVLADKFVKYNEDQEPIDDEGETTEDTYYWDPEKWMVTELNAYVKPEEDGTSYNPIRLKFELKTDPLTNGAILIKSVEFLVPTKDEAVNSAKPITDMITLKAAPSTASINSIAGDTVAAYQVNGNEVTFGEAAVVYNLTGAKVAECAANQSVTLNAGVYVAKVGNQNVKFCVK